MEDERLIKIMGEVDDSLIEEAELDNIKKAKKKKITRIATSLVAAAACILFIIVLGNPGLIRPVKNSSKKETGDFTPGGSYAVSNSNLTDNITSDKNAANATNRVCIDVTNGKVSFDLPANWIYESGSEKTISGQYTYITIHPANATGNITFYYGKVLGVCGTGLTEKEINYGKVKAIAGYYNKADMWSFIEFLDDSGSYTPLYAIANDIESWIATPHENELYQILSTITLE